MRLPAPNRLAVYLTAAAGLLEGLALVVAQADVTTTVGAVGAFLGVVKVVDKWLDGWQAYEAAYPGEARVMAVKPLARD